MIRGFYLLLAVPIFYAFPIFGQSTEKARASGIFCLMPADSVEHPFRGLGREPCWTNPNIQGVALRSQWGKIEPSEGHFDWSLFDEGIALAKQYHKKVSLSVVAGTTTPTWVYQAGATRFDFQKIHKRGEVEGMTQPLPWDKVFLSKWGAFVAEFSKRYDNTSEVAYVTMGGPGRRAETYFLDSAEDVAKLDSMGGIQRWVEGSEKIVDLYASAFQKTPFIFAIAPPIPGPAGNQALKELVDYGAATYPGRFGVRSDGLRPRYEKSSYAARAIRSLSNKAPVGFQMSLPSKGGRQMSAGTLEDALNIGLELGAHFIEVYRYDCNDPSQAQVLERISAKLAASQRG